MDDTHSASMRNCPEWCVQCEYHDGDIREHLGAIVEVTLTTSLRLSSTDNNRAWIDLASEDDNFVWMFPVAIALPLARALIGLAEAAGELLT